MNRDRNVRITGGSKTIETCRETANVCLKVCEMASKLCAILGVVGLLSAMTADVLIMKNRKKIQKGGQNG